jgi:hypothetical protein
MQMKHKTFWITADRTLTSANIESLLTLEIADIHANTDFAKSAQGALEKVWRIEIVATEEK